jgi:adenylate cyclase
VSLFTHRKLQIDILSLFLSLLIVSFAFLIAYSYINNTKMLKEYTHSFINQINETLTEAVNDQFHSGQLLLKTTSSVLAKTGEPFLYNPELELWLIEAIKYYPNVDSYYIALQDGSLIEIDLISEAILNTPPELSSLFAHIPNAKYLMRYIDRKVSPPRETYLVKDEHGKTLLTKQFENPSYDPRTRFWYQEAEKAPDQIYWSDIYPSQTAQIPILTAALSMQNFKTGQFLGVVSVHMTLKSISDFFSKIVIGKTGKVAIVHREGKLIVSPVPTEGGTLQGAFLKAYQIFTKTGESRFTFDFEDSEYLASFLPFISISKRNWMIEVVAPVRDFLSGVINTHYWTIAISIIIALVGALLIAIFAKSISRPIVKLAEESIKIKELELEKYVELRSNIKEIKLMTQSLSAMKNALRSFVCFVPKKVVSQLLEKSQDITLGGEKKEVTVFFSDIYNFSTISEKVPAEEFMKWLEEYFDPLSQVILSNKGVIDKYIGDAIMAYWGALEPMPDHAFWACHAALLFQAKLEKLIVEWKKQNKPLLLTRIGIHTGETLIGNVGTSERMNFTAMGRPVRLAERLEESNKIYKTKILISEDVYQKIQDEFLVRPIDLIEVKNRDSLLKIYELVGQKEGDPEITPSAEMTLFCQEFTSAFNAYQEHKWAEALKLFQKLHEKIETDVPTQIYIKRCEEKLR